MAPFVRNDVRTKADAAVRSSIMLGAPPCPSCTTPGARTCAPWEDVEALECDCMCPGFNGAWLLSNSESEDLLGMPMRLTPLMMECEGDQREQAHSSILASNPSPRPCPSHHTASPPLTPSQAEAQKQDHKEAGGQVRNRWLRPCTPHAHCMHAACTPIAHCMHTR